MPAAHTHANLIDLLPTFRVLPTNKALLDSQCSVCMIEFAVDDDVQCLPCLDKFHVDCIKPWLENNTTCPTCRHPVDNHDLPTTAATNG